MSCLECEGYSVVHCPCCAEPAEEQVTSYETGRLAAMAGDIYVSNPYEDAHDREQWAQGFYEYFYDTLKETAADMIDHLRDLKGLNP